MPRRFTVHALVALTVILICTAWAIAQFGPALKAEEIPTFEIRARVTQTGGDTPATQTFTFNLNVSKEKVKSQGAGWSPWINFGSAEDESELRQYTNRARHHFPIVLMLHVAPMVNPTRVSVQVRFPGMARAVGLRGDLFGPNLGIMVWRDASTGAPRAATMAGYNQRYWHEFDAAALPRSKRPKHFLIVDRFIGGDGDRLDWQEGISHVAETGITAMVVPPAAPLRDMLLKDGIRRIFLGGGIAGGPLGLGSNAAQLEKWSSDFATRYSKAGYQPGDFSLFALADEPGWYYPSALETVDRKPDLLKTFRSYLANQHLTPRMLGAASWEQVYPIGHSKVSQDAPLSTRRLFYWTCRFFPWYAAKHMREGTDQLHRAFTPELKTFSNWSNFAGQFYFEGFPANNPDRGSPDAAMAAPDWFESGRMHATDLVWTEDWFGENRAYQWSFYAAKLRSIAYKNGLEFGGYVIGQVAGNSTYGLVQRILTLVGSGAKAVCYYNFGPAYTFPGNSYSEVPGVPAQLARADRMIAKAEDVLWPGCEQPAQVAILQPRSAEVWDGRHIPEGSRILGAASNDLNGSNLDYMIEEYGDYLALEMSNIPVDFVSEDGLADGTLDQYKVLYITEPDIPSKGQQAITQWVKKGGTLAMVPGAAQGDRYDEPTEILTALAGSPWRNRAYIPNALTLNKTETIGNTPVFGGAPEPSPVGKVIASFNDQIPAVSQDPVGKGSVLYFSYFPGLSYARQAIDVRLSLQKSVEADSLRNLVLTPVRVAEVTTPVQVNTPYVETPMLVSPAGAAITLLNWTGGNLSSVRVTVRSPFQIAKVVSVEHGTIPFHRQGGFVSFSLPLEATDVVKLTH